MSKNKIGIFIVFVFVTLIFGTAFENKNSAASAKFTLTQADGSKLILDKKPERISVLSYATATVLNALDMDVVGMVTTERELPNKLKKIQKLGSPTKPSIENILKLNTDLLITSQSFYNVQKDMFDKNKIHALYIKNITYEDTKNSINYFGRCFNKEKEAQKLINNFNNVEYKTIKKLVGKRRPHIIILHADSDEIQMATKYSFAGSVTEKLRAINIADEINPANKNQTYLKLSLERIVKANPDKILVIIHSQSDSLRQKVDHEIRNDKLWQNTNAIKNNKLYYLDEELFYANPGIKCTDALEYVSDILYN